MPDIPLPLFNFPIVDSSGVPTAEFQRWITQITNTDVIVGAGSPEGVIEATIGRRYMDTSGVASAIEYIKRDADIAGDRTKGWILV